MILKKIEVLQSNNKQFLQKLFVQNKLFGKEYCDFIKKIIEDFKNSFEVVAFYTKYEDAHLVFETLNERGKPLSTSDLIKNYILRMGGETYSSAFFKKWKIIKKKC